MMRFITQVDQVSAEWLTDVLREAGALTEGSVMRIETSALSTNTASASVLRVVYSPDAQGERPEKLFFKLGNRDSEVNFYQAIAPHLRDVPLVRCYHAQFDKALGQSNLLFDDISETHREVSEPADVPAATVRRMVEMMAALHRQWWQHPDLKTGGALAGRIDDVPGYIHGQAQEKLAAFLENTREQISERHRDWITRAVGAWPLAEWQARIEAYQGVTLVHGDFHYWNIAYPRNAADPLYLIDWAVWHVNLPAFDLAYLLAVNTPRARARDLEAELLPYYLECLGRPDYGREQLCADYRMALLFNILMLIFWHGWMDAELWNGIYQQIMESFEELGGEALL